MKKYHDPARIAGLLAKLVTDGISESEKQELAAMIERNGLDNKADLERIIRQEIKLSPDSDEKEAGDRILATLREKAGGRRIPLRRRAMRYAAVLAGLMIFAGGVYLTMRYAAPKNDVIFPLSSETVLEYPSGQNIAVAEATDIAVFLQADAPSGETEGTAAEENLFKIKVPRGTSHTVTLEDGTVVYLYPGSELRFPASFGASARTVELTGEGYFDVARDEARPFSVRAGGASVTVLGTSFNIRAYDGEDIVETVLVSGKVEMNETVLLPNQMAVLDRGDGRVSVLDADGSAYLERTRGVFVFDNRTLDEIMRDLSLWFDFDYSYTDESLKDKSFRFKLPRTEDFNRLTELMKLTGEVEFSISGKHVEILPARK